MLANVCLIYDGSVEINNTFIDDRVVNISHVLQGWTLSTSLKSEIKILAESKTLEHDVILLFIKRSSNDNSEETIKILHYLNHILGHRVIILKFYKKSIIEDEMDSNFNSFLSNYPCIHFTPEDSFEFITESLYGTIMNILNKDQLHQSRILSSTINTKNEILTPSYDFTLNDNIVINEHINIDSKDLYKRSLISLSIEEVIILFKSLNIPINIDIIQSEKIDGNTLFHTNTELEYESIGFNQFNNREMKILIQEIEILKSVGVSPILLLDKNNESSQEYIESLLNMNHTDIIDHINISLKQAIINITDINLIENILEIIPKVIKNDKFQHETIIRKNEFINNILILLEHYKSSMKININILIIIKLLCRSGTDISTTNTENSIFLGENGICETLMTIQSNHIDCSDVLQEVFWCIMNLIITENNKIKFINLNIFQIILTSMKIHELIKGVTEAGCMCLVNLVYNDNDSRDKLGEMGVCEIITNVLRIHTVNAEVVTAGCLAMKNISANSTRNKVLFGDCGSCEVMVSIMQLYIHNIPLLESICWAIRNLSSIETNRIKLYSNGICDKLIDILTLHSDKISICEQICAIIANMAISKEYTIPLGITGACHMIISVVKSHRFEIGVIQQGFSAIRNLATNSINNEKFYDCGTCELVSSLLMYHNKVILLVKAGCWAVRNLSVYEKNRILLGKFSICETLTYIIREHNLISVIIEKACRAIMNLIQGNKENKRKFLEAGINDILLLIVEDFNVSFRAREYSYLTLSHLDVNNINDNNDNNNNDNNNNDNDDNNKVNNRDNDDDINDENDNDNDHIKESNVSYVVKLLHDGKYSESTCMMALAAVRNLTPWDSSNNGNGYNDKNNCNNNNDNSSSNNHTDHDIDSDINSDINYDNILKELGNYGACEQIIQTLKTHVHIPEIVEQGSLAMTHLAQHPPNKVRLEAAGACELLLEVLKLHNMVEVVVEAGCTALYKLLNEKKINLSEIQYMDGYDMVYHCFKEFNSNTQIITSSSYILCHFLKFYTKDYKYEFDNEAFITITDILSTYIASFEIIQNSCVLLTQMHKLKLKLNFDDLDTCENILLGLSAHIMIPNVVDTVLNTIQTMAKVFVQQKVINNTYDVIATVINQYLLTNTNIIILATETLTILCNLSNKNRSCDIDRPYLCDTLVTLINSNNDDYLIVKSTCSAIKSLSQQSLCRIRFINMKIFEILVYLLNKHISIVEVVVAVCKTIVIFATYDYTHGTSNYASTDNPRNICEILLNVLQIHRTTSEVIESACWTIDNLTTGGIDLNRRLFLSLFMEDLLLSISEDSDLSLNSREFARRALCNLQLPISARDVRIVTITDVILGLRQVLNLPNEIEFVSRVLDSIPIIINKDKINHKLLGTTDGVLDAIILILKKNISDENICMKVLIALKILCRYDVEVSSSCEDTIAMLSSMNVSETVMNCIQQHLVIPTVVEEGFWVIRNISTNSINKYQLLQFRVMDTIVAGLLTHPDLKGVCKAGCMCLVNLVYNDNDSRDKLGEMGVCEIITNILRIHTVNAEVVTAGCLAMKNISANSTRNKVLFGDCGSCEVLVSILSTHSENPNVIEQCLWTLRNLSTLDDNRYKFFTNGLCEIFIPIMKIHIRIPNICEQSCAVIVNLTLYDKNRNILGEHGACEFILSVIKTHCNVSSVVEQACSAILNLNSCNIINQKRMVQAGADYIIRNPSNDLTLSNEAREQAKKALQSIECFYLS